MSYLHYLYLFGSFVLPVLFRRAHVLFRCSVRLYPQLFVEEFMSYLGCSVRLYPQLFVEANILNKT